MSTHIGAKPGDIADTILLPGDPLRARYIAETYLEDAFCYNEVRGMYGYTGTYRGRRVSVQGTGMGIPSASIYIHELIRDYGVRTLVRVGTCGAIQKDVNVRDVIVALGACTDSAINRNTFPGIDFAPVGTFDLIRKAYDVAMEKKMRVRVGNVFSADAFYSERPELTRKLGEYGVLAVEMETSCLYTLAAKYGVDSLSICTVSDHILTGEETTALERQTTFDQMIELALETVALS